MENIQSHIVGGAVRDELLGRLPGDRDWVVVGSTPEQLINLGFVQIGRDFPVFLHPQSKEEYALARTCLLYTPPSPRDRTRTRMPSSA